MLSKLVELMFFIHLLNKCFLQNEGCFIPTCVAAKDVISDPENALLGSIEGSLLDFQGWWQDIQLNLPKCIEKKMPIGVGTDSGFPPTTFGFSLWRELALLNSFGMSWDDCFFSATEVNAKVLRQPCLGRLMPGHYADFIIFSKNPILTGLESLKFIDSVFVNGILVSGTAVQDKPKSDFRR